MFGHSNYVLSSLDWYVAYNALSFIHLSLNSSHPFKQYGQSWPKTRSVQKPFDLTPPNILCIPYVSQVLAFPSNAYIPNLISLLMESRNPQTGCRITWVISPAMPALIPMVHSFCHNQPPPWRPSQCGQLDEMSFGYKVQLQKHTLHLHDERKPGQPFAPWFALISWTLCSNDLVDGFPVCSEPSWVWGRGREGGSERWSSAPMRPFASELSVAHGRWPNAPQLDTENKYSYSIKTIPVGVDSL